VAETDRRVAVIRKKRTLSFSYLSQDSFQSHGGSLASLVTLTALMFISGDETIMDSEALSKRYPLMRFDQKHEGYHETSAGSLYADKALAAFQVKPSLVNHVTFLHPSISTVLRLLIGTENILTVTSYAHQKSYGVVCSLMSGDNSWDTWLGVNRRSTPLLTAVLSERHNITF